MDRRPPAARPPSVGGQPRAPRGMAATRPHALELVGPRRLPLKVATGLEGARLGGRARGQPEEWSVSACALSRLLHWGGGSWVSGAQMLVAPGDGRLGKVQARAEHGGCRKLPKPFSF